MKFSELVEKGRGDSATTGILRHTETLRTLFVASGDRAEHYLLWTNSGAVIALLSFMAASERLRTLPAAWHALACFVVGVVLCGFLCAATYHIRSSQFKTWVRDSDRFFANEIDHTVLYGNLERHARLDPLPVILGYLAFASFLLGAFIALTRFASAALAADPSGAGPG